MDHARVSTQSCAQCRAPMVDDQRYCLQCGEPRSDVRSPLASGSSADTRVQTPVVPPIPSLGAAGQGGGVASVRNNSTALIAGVGVLLLAMGVGVLIGRAGAGSAKASPAQVITVGGAGGEGTGATGTTTTAPEPAKEAKGNEKKEKEGGKASPGTGNSLSKPAPPSTLENLRKGGSGQSFEQRSKNLPDVVGT